MLFSEALWWAILWDGKVYIYTDRPVTWLMAIDDCGPIPLCHDADTY